MDWTSVRFESLLLVKLFEEFNDEQRQLREAVMKFTKEEIIPVAAKYDKTME